MNKYRFKRNIVLSVYTLLCVLTVIVLLWNPSSAIADFMVVTCLIMSIVAYMLIRKFKSLNVTRIKKIKKPKRHANKILINDNNIDIGKIVQFPGSGKRQKIRNAKEK